VDGSYRIIAGVREELRYRKCLGSAGESIHNVLKLGRLSE
jgi:hypothetical protein